MALDQSIANWAAYQSDPTKAFKDGQWIDASEYVNPFGVKGPQPGFGTVNDTQGYFADVGGESKYLKYADLAAQGLGTPTSVATGNGNPESPAGTTLRPGSAMPSPYNPDEGFFEGMFDSLKSSLSEPYLPMMLAYGGAALSGAAGPGDWFGGGSGSGSASGGGGGGGGGMNLNPRVSGRNLWDSVNIQGNAPVVDMSIGNYDPGAFWNNPGYSGAGQSWGVNPSGGSMPFDYGSYDPSNPFGFGGSDFTMPGGISEQLTGSGFPSVGGQPFSGYDFGMGYPVGGDMVTNLAGGGLVNSIAGTGMEQALTELAKKVGPTVAKSAWQKFLNGDEGSLMGLLGAAAPGLISEWMKSQQSDQLSGALTKIADQARGDRQPFLDYAKSTLAGGPDAYAAGAGSQALKGVLAKLSASFGNPIGAPAALGIATDSALNNWGNDWRQAANIGLGGNYSGLATNAAMAANPAGGGAGYGDAAASVFAPEKQSLADLMRSLKVIGF